MITSRPLCNFYFELGEGSKHFSGGLRGGTRFFYMVREGEPKFFLGSKRVDFFPVPLQFLYITGDGLRI